MVERAGHRYLCPSQSIREVYNKKLSEILGDFKKCSGDYQSVCDACKLFGYVEGKDTSSSKIKFTDGILNETKPFNMVDEYILLNELSSPKISALEFYLDDENYDYFTYEYAIKNNTKVDNYNVKLKGRKIYHSHQNYGFVSISDDDSDLKKQWTTDYKEKQNIISKLNRSIICKPIKEGTFTFMIIYENITKKQLNELVYVLTLDFSDSNYHKLGLGKPLGLGSVKINVQNVSTRKISKEKLKYTVETFQINSEEVRNALDKSFKDKFLEIKKGTKQYSDVSYPKGTSISKDGKTTEAIHIWFSNNSGTARRKLFANKLKSLKLINRNPQEELKIPSYYDDKRENNNGVNAQFMNNGGGRNVNGNIKM